MKNDRKLKREFSWKKVFRYGILAGGLYGLAALLKKSARLEGENQMLKDRVNDLENDNKKLSYSQWRLQQQLRARQPEA